MKYSIIIPCYNIVQYIKTCLDSIFATGEKNMEIIMVNDGSSDNFKGVGDYFNIAVKDLKTECIYTDISVKIINRQYEGVSVARNVGIEESSGDFIIFIDLDNYISENAFEVADFCISDS